MRFSTTLSVLALALSMFLPVAAAQALRVPLQFPTIQAAIVAAQPGDTVLVAPGVYPESLDFLGKDIVVRSTAGALGTIVAPSAGGRCVSFRGGETATSVLQGFTLTLGSHPTLGGAVYCSSSSPTVVDCVMRNNTAGGPSSGAGIGGAVAVQSGSPHFLRCEIRDNSAVGGTVDGGGVFAGGGVFENCVIENNFATSANGTVQGGGVAAYGTVTFVRCRIRNNSALGFDVYGGGIFHGAGLLRLENTEVVLNRAFSEFELYGGGIWSEGNTVELDHCTVASNAIVDIGFPGLSGGAGVGHTGGGSVTIRNSIVYGNSGDTQQIFAFGSPTSVSHSCVQGGFAGTGNIGGDPQFVVPAFDFHIQPFSPCADAGDPTVPSPGDKDIDGGCRTTGTTPDMGADESGATGLVMSPTSGAAAGGDVVTISGDACGSLTGVSFDGVPGLAFTILGPTSVQVTTPPNPGGIVSVTVTDGISTWPIDEPFRFVGSRFTLTLSESAPGSLDVQLADGPPGSYYFTVYTVDSDNANGGLGSGWWGGLHISFPELADAANIQIPLFQGFLDVNGESLAQLPAGTLSNVSGITLYAVTHAFDPTGADYFLEDVTAPVAYTIP